MYRMYLDPVGRWSGTHAFHSTSAPETNKQWDAPSAYKTIKINVPSHSIPFCVQSLRPFTFLVLNTCINAPCFWAKVIIDKSGIGIPTVHVLRLN